MLVLKRKVGEALIVADEVEIVVLGVEAGGVRLGVRAPREIGVYRKELYEEIVRSNLDSAAPREDIRRLLGGFGVTGEEGDPSRGGAGEAGGA
ncbi:MAG: carbon storage regulator CsrA [Hydrogenibacillus sp.]|nr:carbon storage regulator CsrA [Hydrogenibacillus sp.]